MKLKPFIEDSDEDRMVLDYLYRLEAQHPASFKRLIIWGAKATDMKTYIINPKSTSEWGREYLDTLDRSIELIFKHVNSMPCNLSVAGIPT